MRFTLPTLFPISSSTGASGTWRERRKRQEVLVGPAKRNAALLSLWGTAREGALERREWSRYPAPGLSRRWGPPWTHQVLELRASTIEFTNRQRRVRSWALRRLPHGPCGLDIVPLQADAPTGAVLTRSSGAEERREAGCVVLAGRSSATTRRRPSGAEVDRSRVASGRNLFVHLNKMLGIFTSFPDHPNVGGVENCRASCMPTP